MADREALIPYLRERYTYDAATGTLRNRKGSVIKGLKQNNGYLYLDIHRDGPHRVAIHQVVWALCRGRFPTQIDHINGNPKDNRIENLREVSYSENNMNRVWAWRPNVRTGLPGVGYISCSGRYHIEIYQRPKRHLLYFRSKHEAFVSLTLLGHMFNPPTTKQADADFYRQYHYSVL